MLLVCAGNSEVTLLGDFHLLHAQLDGTQLLSVAMVRRQRRGQAVAAYLLVEDAGGDDLQHAGEDGCQLGRLLLFLLHLPGQEGRQKGGGYGMGWGWGKKAPSTACTAGM